MKIPMYLSPVRSAMLSTRTISVHLVTEGGDTATQMMFLMNLVTEGDGTAHVVEIPS